jgi:recombination protein RecR
MKIKYPKNLLTLMAYLKKLPGVGSKTAERFAFELFKWNKEELNLFGNVLSSFKENLKNCSTCGCLKEHEKCMFCDQNRDFSLMCIISSPKDAFSIEETSYKGLYHVVNTLSPINGYNIDEKNMEILEKRVFKGNTKELIIALDSTLEGDATSLFLKNKFKDKNIIISRLAFGIPMGSSLEYIDEETLIKSFVGRQNF